MAYLLPKAPMLEEKEKRGPKEEGGEKDMSGIIEFFLPASSVSQMLKFPKILEQANSLHGGAAQEHRERAPPGTSSNSAGTR